MPDEEKPTEMVNETQGVEKPTVQQPVEKPQAEMVTLSKADLDKMQHALKEANKEAAERRKQLDEIQKAEQAKKDAELSELEKLQKKLAQIDQEKAEMAQELATRKLEDKKRTIAAKVGLPAEIANRITGATDDELEEDAKALLKIVKPAPAAAPPKLERGVLPANPGVNGTSGETIEQQRARLRGGPSNPWDPRAAEAHGGGAYVRQSKE